MFKGVAKIGRAIVCKTGGGGGDFNACVALFGKVWDPGVKALGNS